MLTSFTPSKSIFFAVIFDLPLRAVGGPVLIVLDPVDSRERHAELFRQIGLGKDHHFPDVLQKFCIIHTTKL